MHNQVVRPACICVASDGSCDPGAPGGGTPGSCAMAKTALRRGIAGTAAAHHCGPGQA